MERANITHVLSVLRLQPQEETFAGFQHHRIDVDDVEDENLLEHFPSAIKFIQSGLDAGGGVLVHWLVYGLPLFPHLYSYQQTRTVPIYLGGLAG